MSKLESFLYTQIKDDNDDLYFNYITTISSLSESSHMVNERKTAILGYYCIVNVIKKISDEKGVEICHIKLLDEIMKCINKSLNDSDNKNIFSAAKCMYNIMIYFNQYVLLNFNGFFDGLLALVKKEDVEIKQIADNLDSALKGIINYSFQGKLPQSFNLLDFFKKIILSITLDDPENKYIVVSWINCINQIPGIKVINILYLFLSDLFDMLKIDNYDLINIVNECLDDFYNEIENDFDDIPHLIKIKIFEIVLQKCETNYQEEEKIKIKAFNWANLFLKKYKFLLISIKNKNKRESVKKRSSINLLHLNSNENNSKENNLQDKEKKKDGEEANESDYSVDDDDNKIFPFDLFIKFLKIIFNTLKDEKNLKDKKKTTELRIMNSINDIKKEKDTEDDLYTIIINSNNFLLSIITQYKMNDKNIDQLENILMKYLFFENNDLLLSVIKWIEKCFNKFCEEAFSKDFNKFIENFAFIATYKDKEIFETGIKTLCKIEKCRKGSINIIIINILNKLEGKDDSFIIKRAKEFVKVLCRELNVKHVYLTFADILSRMTKTNFVCKIINILNMVLLTSNDTEELRNLLKNIQKTINIEDKYFFEKLFSIWCINPVSCLVLCLIAEDFELSYHLLNKCGKIKLNQENYLEYAQLVQVLESKEFTSK